MGFKVPRWMLWPAAILGLLLAVAFVLNFVRGDYLVSDFLPDHRPLPPAAVPRVAHAGGGWHRYTYTNSIEALNANASRYDLFELDFMFTKDGHLVCMHDWDGDGNEPAAARFVGPPSYATFVRQIAARGHYHNCTFETLAEWLNTHPGKRIVTDTKSDNIPVLTYIAQHYPAHGERFIPQIYWPSEYAQVRALGYRHVIWTLYKYHYGANPVLYWAPRMQLYAMTMWAHRARHLARPLRRMGIPIYVHTVNSPDELKALQAEGVSEIYTDWLPEKR